MERIGLIGGVSWASTMEYYRRLNMAVQETGENFESADLAIISLNFSKILSAQKQGNDSAELEILSKAAHQLAQADVKKILICSNTTSNTCDKLSKLINIPIINIIDATADKLLRMGVTCTGLIGTQYVMEREFYRQRLEARGIKVLVPRSRTREAIHESIYQDLCRYMLTDTSRGIMYRAIDELAESGAEAVILGCTEIPLIVRDSIYQNSIKIIDSIDAHIEAALSQTRLSTEFPQYQGNSIEHISI
ncbi:amino acid racemase [Xenorhabdus bovienii]|uniref:aspartate/glutamate racemase family protein n=1 Tax=Xenorhabdus bovienii TaxID=40576 RepID=UPI0023B26648|nr:amino acid racemase [Xenorhabdus bovienii]MDE9563437.1 amino acid racemase [Xenorhabdus bovienii]